MGIDVIRLAREASQYGESGLLYEVAKRSPLTLERFAALATADLKAANAELLEALRQLLHDDSEQYAWAVWEKHGGAA